VRKNICIIVGGLLFAAAVSLLVLLLQETKVIASHIPLFVTIIIVLFIATIAIYIYGFWPIKKGREEGQGATQIYDMEMGEHITQIKDVLKAWRGQLQSLADKRNPKDIDAVRNDTIEFQYARQHCPSLGRIYPEFLIYVGLWENDTKKLESKQEIKKSRGYLRDRIKSVIGAIDKSLKSHEYTKNRCGGCPQNIIRPPS
jgi:hypothetical protein